MRVCVFSSSSKATKQHFVNISYELGELLALRGHICVNGGGSSGGMGALTTGQLFRKCVGNFVIFHSISRGIIVFSS